MRPIRLNPVRRFMLWWFEPPHGDPYVSVNISVDFREARRWLNQLQGGPRISVQALLTACLARLFVEFPVLNRRVVGGRIYQLPSVGIAAPVNLIGHKGGSERELSMMLLEDAQTLTLRQTAERLTRTIDAERRGEPQNRFVKQLLRVVKHSPEQLNRQVYERLAMLNRRSDLAWAGWKLAPVSTALSNPGSAFGGMDGVQFKGGAVSLPTRLIQVGSLWGISTVQQEVMAIDGEPTVVDALPIVLVFDHRLFDGVMAGNILKRLAEMILDPTSLFGEDGSE